MDFRFLAPLGMTVRRGRIVAAIPFCLPLSAHDGRGDELASVQLIILKLTECLGAGVSGCCGEGLFRKRIEGRVCERVVKDV